MGLIMHEDIPYSGGGGSKGGSRIVVTTTESSLYGKTVTISDGTITISDTFSNSGSVTFEGVTLTGNLTVTSTDGTDTARLILRVPYYGNYNVRLTFWSATVEIQGDENLYDSTVTVKNSLHTTVDTIILDSSGQGTFYAIEADTYTFEYTYDGETYSKDLVVSAETTYSITLETIPDGSTTTPTDDIQKWLACAGIKDKAYTTLTQVLGDSETYNALLGDSNACAYMKRSTTWATNLCADALAMSILGRYDVACDALLSDATWASAIANSTYFESVLNVKVPVMTSNTAPSGECIGSSAYSGYDYFKAFDGNDGTAWNNNVQTNTAWVGYDFGESTRVSKVIVKVNPTGAASTNIKTLTNVTLRGSDDKTSWEDVTILANSIGDTNEHSYAFAVNESHRYYSVQATGGNDNVVRFVTLKFYGRTSSGAKIHGATGESAYILESGSPVTITDPSTLDAGTYTVYSRVAKDPANLSNDYSKTIRICPNTEEIVLMPERAVYWWGYESADLQDCSTANGWSFAAGYSFQAPTHNTGNVQVYSTASNNICGIGTKNAITDNAVFNVIYSGVERSSSNYTSWGGFSNNKNCESFNGNYSDNSLNTLTHKTAQKTNTSLSNNVFIGNSAMGKCTLYAMYLSNE